MLDQQWSAGRENFHRLFSLWLPCIQQPVSSHQQVNYKFTENWSRGSAIINWSIGLSCRSWSSNFNWETYVDVDNTWPVVSLLAVTLHHPLNCGLPQVPLSDTREPNSERFWNPKKCKSVTTTMFGTMLYKSKTRQSKHCVFSIYIFDISKSMSMVRLVRAEKMVLSGLVFARKIARMILIQNLFCIYTGFDGSLDD